MKDMVVTFSALKEYVLKLEERIEKLEHDRDAMQNWGRQFDFMDKQSFESIGDKLKTFPEILLERDKEILELKKIISDFAGTDKQTGQSETYNSLLLRVHTENRELYKEIERLKSELEKSTQHCPSCGIEYWKNHTLYELSVKQQKIIEQALEYIRFENSTGRSGILKDGVKEVKMDIMEFYEITAKLQDILEGST